MKYKCLVCGQIIDNNEMCPFCGSDSSQIIPLDGGSSKKGHYRCLVCGRETDNGEYCPYCGSQRLYNLDTNRSEDTQSLDIKNEEDSEEQNDVDETVSEHNQNAIFDKEDENSEEPIEDSSEEESFNEEAKPEESLESRYFNSFGELLPLESISNPDPNKVSALYRMGINRGEKITPEEIANAFEIEQDNDEPIEEVEKNVNNEEVELEEELDERQEENMELPINKTPESIQLKVLRTVEDLLHNYDEDSVTTGVLNDLKDRALDELTSKKSGEELENEIIELLSELITYDKEVNSPSLNSDEKYLKLLKILFEKE